jgi:hypothetical protein
MTESLPAEFKVFFFKYSRGPVKNRVDLHMMMDQNFAFVLYISGFLNEYLFSISSIDIDECKNPELAAKCVENAECCNLPAHYSCKCKPGFQGDGEKQCLGKPIEFSVFL